MATDQTDGEPPSRGSTILVNIGSTENISSAETKRALAKSGSVNTELATVFAAGWAAASVAPAWSIAVMAVQCLRMPPR